MQFGIIPAYAGSTTTSSAPPRASTDHPRIRGEHREYPAGGQHARGIIPAYAGSTVVPIPGETLAWDHPRIRGEHAADPKGKIVVGGSSPHTRGAPGDELDENIAERIIPAYAGSTRKRCRAVSPRRDHPRIRGEHKEALQGSFAEAGSSPHTRGAQGSAAGQFRRGGIIPAYAGSTSSLSLLDAAGSDHPRIRGEHLTTVVNAPIVAGSSPHTRGARAHRCRPVVLCGIIPAYAGSTEQ